MQYCPNVSSGMEILCNVFRWSRLQWSVQAIGEEEEGHLSDEPPRPNIYMWGLARSRALLLSQAYSLQLPWTASQVITPNWWECSRPTQFSYSGCEIVSQYINQKNIYNRKMLLVAPLMQEKTCLCMILLYCILSINFHFLFVDCSCVPCTTTRILTERQPPQHLVKSGSITASESIERERPQSKKWRWRMAMVSLKSS